tara:strand:+ start:1377 stop:2354 length:978 start_codon:yes stop_codon:yes gene_type:complete
MIDYGLFTILIFINFVLFNIFLKFAKGWNFVDESMKFSNPITITSAGVIFYLNLMFVYSWLYFTKNSFAANLPNNFNYTLIFLTILILISTVDDVRPIDPKIRLFFQLVCIYFSISSIPIYELMLPTKVSIFICLCLWVYILNITNFTDGSDGFLAINTIFVFMNLVFLENFLNLKIFSYYFSIFLLPSIIIFLYFNKPNAKTYMGDSGSILIGFINGFMFLELFTLGMSNIAISLLIYPLLDCSIALIKKTLDGKMPWTDTSNYSFLQPSIKKNQNKFFVFKTNIVFNFVNSLLIIVQLYFGWFYILLNILVTIIFLRIYEKKN